MKKKRNVFLRGKITSIINLLKKNSFSKSELKKIKEDLNMIKVILDN